VRPPVEVPRVRYKPAEVGRIAGVSIRTVWAHIKTGKLEAHRLGGDGPLGITPEALQAWVRGAK
jgi:hypothetical protein